jgi:hypothetical protein
MPARFRSGTALGNGYVVVGQPQMQPPDYDQRTRNELATNVEGYLQMNRQWDGKPHHSEFFMPGRPNEHLMFFRNGENNYAIAMDRPGGGDPLTMSGPRKFMEDRLATLRGPNGTNELRKLLIDNDAYEKNILRQYGNLPPRHNAQAPALAGSLDNTAGRDPLPSPVTATPLPPLSGTTVAPQAAQEPSAPITVPLSAITGVHKRPESAYDTKLGNELANDVHSDLLAAATHKSGTAAAGYSRIITTAPENRINILFERDSKTGVVHVGLIDPATHQMKPDSVVPLRHC